MLNTAINKNKVLILALGVTLSPAFAQFEITKSTINSGGGTLESGSYQLSGSIAQVDASTQLTGGDFSLTGGFWQKNNDLIFKNGFE